LSIVVNKIKYAIQNFIGDKIFAPYNIKRINIFASSRFSNKILEIKFVGKRKGAMN